ncbi:protein CEPU-1-like [Tropilaelaps mercedesae]|uniref:Protein CEPU-1-like n=1 Tax=Tropilaelaps mercedesae TaxID=418985 RepID=A0A1V9X3N4_9ACAR|nr:protein CEPU-1-like [Tropilaelaps mercedesae]
MDSQAAVAEREFTMKQGTKPLSGERWRTSLSVRGSKDRTSIAVAEMRLNSSGGADGSRLRHLRTCSVWGPSNRRTRSGGGRGVRCAATKQLQQRRQTTTFGGGDAAAEHPSDRQQLRLTKRKGLQKKPTCLSAGNKPKNVGFFCSVCCRRLAELLIDVRCARGVQRQPSFAEPISNVTVAAGRTVTLSCVVDNLGTYKVRSSFS